MTSKLSILLFLAITLTIHHASANSYRDPRAIPLPPNVNPAPGAWDGFQNFSGSHSGQRVEGLSKLKSCLNDFGYITTSEEGFSDDYDESLKSAIKLFQQNFRLAVTGELDDATVSLIVTPRCVAADIINGTNTMGTQKTPAAHYAFEHGNPRWPSSETTLTYAFLAQNNLTDPLKSVFGRAFSHWSEVIPLNFTETENYDEAEIKIGFYIGEHGDFQPFDGVLGVLAHSFPPTDGRFHLDGAELWVYDADVRKWPVKTAIDLESVAVHEIGHLLGLDHSNYQSAVMYPYVQPMTRKVILSNDDVDGIQSLYGRNPNYNDSDRQPDRYSGAGDGGAWLLLRWRGIFWGLAAVLWCLIF